jgi:uncharacterized protein (DUF2252 family)
MTTDASTPTGRLLPDERARAGKDARAAVPRSSHSVLPSSAPGRDPVAVLERQALSRLPDLVPLRYTRMLASPFAFYRGAAAIMAGDLADTPASGFTVQLCGDAHLSNFGIFASPERREVFDINDFDETSPGPWEWDVKRLAASLEIACRDRRFTTDEGALVVSATVAAYREAMRRFAQLPNLDVWYAKLDTTDLIRSVRQAGLGAQNVERTKKVLGKARGRDNLRALKKLTTTVDGTPQVPITELFPDVERAALEGVLRTLLSGYRNTLAPDRQVLYEGYAPVDFARKVVGVGSVGTRCYVGLFLGRDDSDPLFLQVKEAEQSVLEPHAGASSWPHHGQRVVAGQRLMQASSDILLGWETGPEGRHFYVRQMWDGKGSIPVEILRPPGMALYGRACGWTLARAHARSGDRIAIASYLGSGPVFDAALVEFARAYADRNEQDYRVLQDAAQSGRVPTAVE